MRAAVGSAAAVRVAADLARVVRAGGRLEGDAATPLRNAELEGIMFTNREAAAVAFATALAARRAFESEHAALLAQHQGLLKAVAEACWPPSGHEECSGEDEHGECSAIFPVGRMPEGWRERQFECGDGGSGVFFCPAHAEQGREHHGRCGWCSN